MSDELYRKTDMVYRMNSHNSIENIKQPVFGFTVLGSGSKGNACVIHCPQGKILLDAGFSAKELKSRLDNSRIDSRSIRAILVTHEHEDHVRGVRVFADSMGIPLYVTPETCRVMASKKQMALSGYDLIDDISSYNCCFIL